MARDERVARVTERWAPRFVTNGVPLADWQEASGRIGTWDGWIDVWAELAARHEALGREALAAGHAISAGEHLQTAGVVYHFAKFVFVEDMARLRAVHAKAIECRRLALPCLDPPGERVAIPYDGAYLYGILRKPRGVVRPPVLVMCMGMDSAKEEMATNEAPFLARGVATLAFDGPGQGEGEYDWPIRPDYEVAVAAVIDWVETRTDLDAARIGLWGVSFGGYYAPRAAAFEPRIRACVAICGPFDYAGHWHEAGTSEVFTARAHCTTPEAGYEVARRINLAGVAERIACPLYIVGGELDRVTPPDEQRRLAAAAKGPVTLNIVPGGNHVVNNLPHLYRPQSADWMAGWLGARVA